MTSLKFIFEHLIASLWNGRRKTSSGSARHEGLDVGSEIVDETPTARRLGIAESRRAEGLAILGKTGSGKSYLIRWLAQQDIRALRGFTFFDLHGDVTPFLLKCIAAQEHAIKKDLSDRLIVVDPSDPEFSVGINPLDDLGQDDRFVQIAEFSQILKDRWHLDGFGARTDELLRNSLYALGENHLTLIELAPFLSNQTFRSRCIARVGNPEVKAYFAERYDQLSDAMRRVVAEPVLNKISLFVSDARFRHLLGQQHSTFSLVDAIDDGRWIIVNLDKGRLGERAGTFGSLFLTKIKHAAFSRRKRNLFTVFADEVQNLVAFGGGLETMIAECRKRAVGLVTANQFLAQHSAEMQAALLSMGSFCFFQLAGQDAQQIATLLDGGKTLAERLKNLPRQHFILKTVHERWREGLVPLVREPAANATDLLRRSNARWARRRSEVEVEIQNRRAAGANGKSHDLDDWE